MPAPSTPACASVRMIEGSAPSSENNAGPSEASVQPTTATVTVIPIHALASRSEKRVRRTRHCSAPSATPSIRPVAIPAPIAAKADDGSPSAARARSAPEPIPTSSAAAQAMIQGLTIDRALKGLRSLTGVFACRPLIPRAS